jgi:hypothetical protein
VEISVDKIFLPPPVADWASVSVAAAEIRLSRLRRRRSANANCTDFARNTVQVIKDARTRLKITAFTSGSAAMNMDHGDNSRGFIDQNLAVADTRRVRPAPGEILLLPSAEAQ